MRDQSIPGQAARHATPASPDAGPPAAAPEGTRIAAAPAAPTPEATRDPAAMAAAGAAWRAALSTWLQGHTTYPEAARRGGEQGRVVVRVTVDRGGQVLGMALADGSGAASLDQAAQAMLRGARLPPFPPGMIQAQVTVAVPVRYALER